MVDVVRQRPVSNPHPYMVEAYMAVDGSEVCFSLNPPKAYCARDCAVKEVKLELEFSRYETYDEKIREAYRPKGLLAYAAAAREYVRCSSYFSSPFLRQRSAVQTNTPKNTRRPAPRRKGGC
jgi:hypothetical protein